MHLDVPRSVILPDGIGNMKSLRTLGLFELGNSLDNIKGLRELTNLTNLEITCDYYIESRDEVAARCREVLHALENLCNLKHLHIVSYEDLVRSCFQSGLASSIAFMTWISLLWRCWRMILELFHSCPPLSTWFCTSVELLKIRSSSSEEVDYSLL